MRRLHREDAIRRRRAGIFERDQEYFKEWVGRAWRADPRRKTAGAVCTSKESGSVAGYMLLQLFGDSDVSIMEWVHDASAMEPTSGASASSDQSRQVFWVLLRCCLRQVGLGVPGDAGAEPRPVNLTIKVFHDASFRADELPPGEFCGAMVEPDDVDHGYMFRVLAPFALPTPSWTATSSRDEAGNDDKGTGPEGTRVPTESDLAQCLPEMDFWPVDLF
jgi:hypothetical protein